MTHLGSVNDQAARAEKAEALVEQADDLMGGVRSNLKKAERELAEWKRNAVQEYQRASDAERERDEARTAAACEGDIADTFKRERDEARALLVRWCHSEGGADGEKLFEDTMKLLDPDDTGKG